MAKINAWGAKEVARVKRTFTIEHGTVVTQHKVLCSDGRILKKASYRESDGRRHSTGYTLVCKTIATPDSWMAAQLLNGWKRNDS
jgi:hypothetical protein